MSRYTITADVDSMPGDVPQVGDTMNCCIHYPVRVTSVVETAPLGWRARTGPGSWFRVLMDMPEDFPDPPRILEWRMLFDDDGLPVAVDFLIAAVSPTPVGERE